MEKTVLTKHRSNHTYYCPSGDCFSSLYYFSSPIQLLLKGRPLPIYYHLSLLSSPLWFPSIILLFYLSPSSDEASYFLRTTLNWSVVLCTGLSAAFLGYRALSQGCPQASGTHLREQQPQWTWHLWQLKLLDQVRQGTSHHTRIEDVSISNGICQFLHYSEAINWLVMKDLSHSCSLLLTKMGEQKVRLNLFYNSELLFFFKRIFWSLQGYYKNICVLIPKAMPTLVTRRVGNVWERTSVHINDDR